MSTSSMNKYCYYYYYSIKHYVTLICNHYSIKPLYNHYIGLVCTQLLNNKQAKFTAKTNI